MKTVHDVLQAGSVRPGADLDGPGHHGADEVHETQVCVAVSDQSSSGQRHAWFLYRQRHNVQEEVQKTCLSAHRVSDVFAGGPAGSAASSSGWWRLRA